MARVPVNKRNPKRRVPAKRASPKVAPARRPAPRRAPPVARRAQVVNNQQNTIVPVPRSLGWAFDAFDKRHLPLDEVTAPYTVSSFTSTLEFASSHTEDQIVLISPFQYSYSGVPPGELTDIVAALYNGSVHAGGTAMAATQTCRSPILGNPVLGEDPQYSDIRARLHNLSIKVQCLGTSAGLYPPGSVYYGTVPSIETGIGNSAHPTATARTLQQVWIEDSIAVGYLKGVPAVSLISNPAIVHSAVCETINYKTWQQMVAPKATTDLGSLALSLALEPILISIPKCGAAGTAVNYRVIIGQQWCTRHPNNVLLRSTQKHHKATAPGVWHKASEVTKTLTSVAGEGLATGAMEALGRAAASILRPQAAIGGPVPLFVE